LFLTFNAFGDNAQSHGTTKPDHRIDDRCRVRVLCHVGYETTVDFDAIERKRPQSAERGVSGSEVVYGDADTKIL
jgi:hypothetical protein